MPIHSPVQDDVENDVMVGHRAAAVLRSRWPSTEVRSPLREDGAVDPHGMWSGSPW